MYKSKLSKYKWHHLGVECCGILQNVQQRMQRSVAAACCIMLQQLLLAPPHAQSNSLEKNQLIFAAWYIDCPSESQMLQHSIEH